MCCVNTSSFHDKECGLCPKEVSNQIRDKQHAYQEPRRSSWLQGWIALLGHALFSNVEREDYSKVEGLSEVMETKTILGEITTASNEQPINSYQSL